MLKMVEKPKPCFPRRLLNRRAGAHAVRGGVRGSLIANPLTSRVAHYEPEPHAVSE